MFDRAWSGTCAVPRRSRTKGRLRRGKRWAERRATEARGRRRQIRLAGAFRGRQNEVAAYESSLASKIASGLRSQVHGESPDYDTVSRVTSLKDIQSQLLPMLAGPHPKSGGSASLDATRVRELLAAGKALYGADGRVEAAATSAPRAVVRAVGLLAGSREVVEVADGYQLKTRHFGDTHGLCPGQRFREQPVLGYGSGFLVAPDLLATAGHCVVGQDLADIRVIFDFELEDGKLNLHRRSSEVYRVVEEISALCQDWGADYAIVRLDRAVEHVQPLRLAARDANLHDRVYAVGHPMGLPKKVAPGAQVLGIEDPYCFTANLDTFRGNSGSPVLNANHEVCGILVRGKHDFIWQGDCKVAASFPLHEAGEQSCKVSVWSGLLGNKLTNLREARGHAGADPPERSLAQLYAAMSALTSWTNVQPVLSGGPSIDVRKMYVELVLAEGADSGRWQSSFSEASDFDARSGSARHYITPESLLARTQNRAVILGPPGSGKSTLLRWLFSHVLDRFDELGVVPIPVQLGHFARAVELDPHATLLEHAVKQAAVQSDENLAPLSPRALAAVAPQRVLFLLDGWDEVPLPQRELVRAAIDRDTRKVPTLITSRHSGAPQLLDGERTTLYDVGPLTSYAAAELVTRYAAFRSASALAAGVLEQLERAPSLWTVATNPYLLTLFAEIIFRHRRLPDPLTCTPTWILSEATQLIVSDFNAVNPSAALTGSDLRQIRELAKSLSFDEQNKRAQFDEEVQLKPGNVEFSKTHLRLTRFFSGVPGALPRYEFTHLRLQEYLAATGAIEANLVADQGWFRQRVLSTFWKEEARFMAALLAAQPTHPCWLWLRELVQNDDTSAEILRRVSSLVAAAGASDGGLALVGHDLRERLWQRIRSGEQFMDETLEVLAQLDVGFLAHCFREIPSDDSVDDALLLETIYRLMPLSLRRDELDADLRSSTMHWLIGSPARAFPNLMTLTELTEIAADATRPTEARVDAIRNLGAARALSSVEALIPLIESSDPELSTVAIETLAKIGGPAAALAVARLLVQRGPRDLNLAQAALNALSLSSYGILETRSLRYLVEIVQSHEDEGAVELALLALERAPIPKPPPRLLEMIQGRDSQQREVRVRALGLLPGIRDEAFLNQCLDLAIVEAAEPEIRHQILRRCPFIPVTHSNLPALWRFVEVSGRVDTTAVDLWLRTVRYFPNHPHAATVNRFIHKALEVLAAGSESDVHRSVLRHLAQAPPILDLQPYLVSAAQDDRLGPSIRASAARALAPSALSEADAERLLTLLTTGDAALAELFGVIGSALFLRRPAQAPMLLARIAESNSEEATNVRDGVLRTAHREGYIIIGNAVFTPKGLPAE